MRKCSCIRAPAAILLALVLSACGGEGERSPSGSSSDAAISAKAGLNIVDVQTARMIGDTRSAEQATTFSPTDTILAVVLTEGSGSATMSAHWFFGMDRQPIYQEEHRVDARGRGTSQFAIAKADGFPPGRYAVDVRLEGKLVATREFEVR